MIFTIKKRNTFISNKKRGMTYIELIVVMGIFSVLYSVVLFNYKTFQERMNIRGLSQDVVSALVRAQKASVSGELPAGKSFASTWKPSYGLYFNLEEGTNIGDRVFYYFTDLSQDDFFNYGTFLCPGGADTECLQKINITKGNFISKISLFSGGGGTVELTPLSDDSEVNITFQRPDIGACIIYQTNPCNHFQSAEIEFSSLGGEKSTIKVYAYGKIDIL